MNKSAFQSKVYRLVDRFEFLKKLLYRGGIQFRWGLIISVLLMFIISLFALIFFVMSNSALLDANDRLCKTIAGNISSSETILTAEKKPFRRSLILQDMVRELSLRNIDGLVYCAVYDLSGQLAERKTAYAAHTESYRRGQWIPKSLFDEINTLQTFEKKKIIYTDKKKNAIPCYQYRSPFTFFDVKVGVIEIVFTEASILGPVKRMTLYIIIAGVFMLILGVSISRSTARGMVRPIKVLSGGMNRVRSGDLGVELNIERHDEFGLLSRDFNNMINHLREKLHMQKFVSESTISMIREKKGLDEIELGGKRENLVFLFSDVRGFTAMSEKMEPEDVVAILNEYLDLQAQIIKRNNGDIDKFVGDEVMAVFSGKNKHEQALISAVEIVRAIEELNEKRKAEGALTVDVGIGIHGGDVVHGRMGSRDRMDNTSIGDAVNLSARLCSQASPGMVLVSKEIMTRAPKGKFKGKKLEPITVKGKQKPIEIFSITGMK